MQQAAHRKGEADMLERMTNGFSYGALLAMIGLMTAGASVTLTSVLLAGVVGAFWQGIKPAAR